VTGFGIAISRYLLLLISSDTICFTLNIPLNFDAQFRYRGGIFTLSAIPALQISISIARTRAPRKRQIQTLAHKWSVGVIESTIRSGPRKAAKCCAILPTSGRDGRSRETV
jgi:hypothetical protein